MNILSKIAALPPEVAPNNSDQIGNPLLKGSPLENLTGVQFIQALLPALISLTLVVGALVFFFMLILGAIQWITSGGDKNGLEGAKGKITAALIGIVVLFSVFAIIKAVETFFGLSILTLDISSLVIK